MLGGLLDAEHGASLVVGLKVDHLHAVCVTRIGHRLHGLQKSLQPASTKLAFAEEGRELKGPKRGVACPMCD